MGLLNRRALLRQLQKAGVASRAHLAKSLGMSQPTAGRIVDELLEMDVVEEIEVPAGHAGRVPMLGRPGRLLRLNQSRAKLLGIHLGVNETTVAGLSLGVDDGDQWQYQFALEPSIANAAKAWEKNLRAIAKKIGHGNFLGVLLSAPGIVDESANRILFSPNVHWTEKDDLAAIIHRIWNVPVLLVQEQRALALGHHFANPECEDFLLVDFGEGVGGAIIVDGKPLANPLPISGEIGHTPVLGNRRKCGCGAVGCMETLVSIRGLLESFVTSNPRKKKSWAELNAHISENGIEPWLAQALDAAAGAIAEALNVLGLRQVVITGSMTELPPVVFEHLSHAIENGAMWARFGEVKCVRAPRRRIAGLVAVGIDRLVVPAHEETNSKKSAERRDITKQN